MLEAILRAPATASGSTRRRTCCATTSACASTATQASDAALCAAFDAVEDARGARPLTYFEFGTLAALWLFARAGLDALILEVGLGGRLDAVNIVDADVAVVTSVDLDHMDYLGPTREDIGREKAGIFRAGRPAICADRDPPAIAARARARRSARRCC